MNVVAVSLITLAIAAATAVAKEDPAALADLRAGTAAARYDFFASASLPFGMVSLHPDTRHGELWSAGYRDGDRRVLSFSHVHHIQTAGIPVMPGIGPVRGHLGLEADAAPFCRETEVIEPGYHRIFLTDRRILCEFTATDRAGLHRYTFTGGGEARITMDLTATLGPCAMESASFRKTGPAEITGMSMMAPTHRRKIACPVFFVARFDREIASLTGWRPGPEGRAVLEETDSLSGPGIGLSAGFGVLPEQTVISLKVGISFTSEEGARRNLEGELPGWDFEGTRAAARVAWNAHLGRIRVEGGGERRQRKLYTDLFRTAVGKRHYHDLDGRWADRSGAETVIRQLPEGPDGKPAFALLDMDCFWGSQWNLNLLWTLAWPDRANDAARTLLEYHRHHGILPRGPWGGRDSYVMVGDPGTPLLAALACNGRAEFDLKQAFEAAWTNAMPGGVRARSGYEAADPPCGGGIEDYVKLGYVPVEVADGTSGWHSGGTALTLEYAYQDFAVAQLARLTGRHEEERKMLERSRNYQNVFRADAGHMAPRRRDGSWFEPFAAVDPDGKTPPGFIEGNAAQYTWHVPHDPQRLVELLGGPEAVVRRLEAMFERARASRFHAPHGLHGGREIEYGNQPALHLAHLFHHAGRPDLAWKWVAEVRDSVFSSTTPEGGWPGDEDQGQLGAFSALMAIGLFDTAGLLGNDPRWQITVPVFEKTTIDLGAGRTLVVATKGLESGVARLRSARWNGRALEDFTVSSKDLLEGGLLELEAGS